MLDSGPFLAPVEVTFLGSHYFLHRNFVSWLPFIDNGSRVAVETWSSPGSRPLIFICLGEKEEERERTYVCRGQLTMGVFPVSCCLIQADSVSEAGTHPFCWIDWPASREGAFHLCFPRAGIAGASSVLLWCWRSEFNPL